MIVYSFCFLVLRINMSLFLHVQACRKKPETARVGHRYSVQNDVEIMEQAARGVSITAIAKQQKRTPQAIRARIIRNALQIMKRETCSLEEISRRYHIDMKRLTTQYQRMCEEERKMTKWVRESTGFQ
jgi:hypothetical protein